jgi:hypothetical protein
MLSKCANPACPTPFLYLHEGRIFNIEVEAPAHAGPDLTMYANGHVRRLVHYWLCDNCVRSMTVVYEHGSVCARLARLALSAGEPPRAAA